MTKKEKWDVFIGLFSSITIILAVISFLYEVQRNNKAEIDQQIKSEQAQKNRYEDDKKQKEKDLEEKEKWRQTFEFQNKQFIESQNEFASSVTNISQALKLMKTQDVLERERDFNLTLIEPYQNLVRSLETIKSGKSESVEYKTASEVIRFSSEALIAIINDTALKYLHIELKKSIDLYSDIYELIKNQTEYYTINYQYIDSIEEITKSTNPFNKIDNIKRYIDLKKIRRERDYTQLSWNCSHLFGRINALNVDSVNKYSMFYSDQINKNNPIEFFDKIDSCIDSLLQYSLRISGDDLFINKDPDLIDQFKVRLYISKVEFNILKTKFLESPSLYLLSLKNKLGFISVEFKNQLEIKNPFLKPK